MIPKIELAKAMEIMKSDKARVRAMTKPKKAAGWMVEFMDYGRLHKEYYNTKTQARSRIRLLKSELYDNIRGPIRLVEDETPPAKRRRVDELTETTGMTADERAFLG